ncbi:DUF1328 domain-containing protein [Pendulispora rubella]|uniref:DUF1328 domain-containing protein n=1 Tax=Pendulispora rubella TaxID=2741070 RepID=A0ABZ2KQ45_9BACT
MLHWTAVFSILAAVAAFLGFGAGPAEAVGIAKALFFIFLALALLTALLGRRRPML